MARINHYFLPGTSRQKKPTMIIAGIHTTYTFGERLVEEKEVEIPSPNLSFRPN